MKRFYLPFIAALLQFLTTSTRFVTSDISVTNAAAWRFLRTGTPYVPHSWINSATANEYHLIRGHWVADRMPGNILTLAPFQWVGGPKPSIIGFMVLGFIATFTTVYMVQWLWGNVPAFLVCIVTPLLAMNKEVWPQTLVIPAMLLGFIIVERWRQVWLFAPIIFYVFIVRPPFAVALLAVFAVYSYLRPRLIVYGLVGLATGAVFLLLWTHTYFGFWSLQGGYAIDGHKPASFASSLYVGFLSPQRGILFYTPWAVVLFDRMSERWRYVCYLLLIYTVAEWWQYNAFGGDGFLAYRYPLPFIVCLVPILWKRWNYFYATMAGWSTGVLAFVFIHDKLQWNNPGRDPNQFPMPMIYWGVVTCLIALSASMVTAHALRIASRKRGLQNVQSV